MPARVPDDVDLLYAELPMWEPLVDARRVLGEEGMTGGCSPYMTLALRQLDEAVDWSQVRDCLHRVHRIAFDDTAIVPLWQLVEYFVYHDSLGGIAAQARVSLPEHRAMAAALPVPGGKMNVFTRLPKILTAMLFLVPLAAQAADQSVWPLTPYHVCVFVAVAPEASLTPRLESSLVADLTERIEAVVGAPWDLTVSAPPPALRRAMLCNILALQASEIPFASPEPDKILLVAVSAIPGGLAVTARDFDVRTRTLNTAVTRRVWQVGCLCDAALDAILTAFSPLARIERLENRRKRQRRRDADQGRRTPLTPMTATTGARLPRTRWATSPRRTTTPTETSPPAVDGELTDLPGSAANVRLAETAYTYDAMSRLVQTDQAFFDPPPE